VTDQGRHWERLYARGGTHSWDQDMPIVTLALLAAAGVRSDASVVDVGGGDGALAAALTDRGFGDLTVLDIAEHGLAAGRDRVGPAAEQVAWLVTDVRTWRPERTFDVWHDRAVFHFLVDPADRAGYGAALRRGTRAGSLLVVGTFAAHGPASCSGLPVARYDADRLRDALTAASGVTWQPLRATAEEHRTPAGAVQPFTWLVLRRPG
jgi:SAM-dependent methyltransferase